MCNKDVYKRFKKLYDYIADEKCSSTKEFNGVYYKYKTFHTKLGDRNVIAHMLDKTVLIGYHDWDNSLLFMIAIDPYGKFQVLHAVIDELAIFSAIYELETIIYNKKAKKRGEMLVNLLNMYGKFTPVGYYY